MRFIRLQNTVSVLTQTWSFWRSVVIVSAIVAACLCASAANVNGRIRGTVTDPENAVVAGVHVTAANIGTGVKYETVSGADGGYLFPELPIGQYSISVKHEGFRSFIATGIVLNIDQEYVQPIRLSVGSVSTVVEVSSSSVQVDTTDMQFSNIVDSTQMVDLPLMNRNFTGLELTLPGVQASTGSERIGGNGSYSVSGSQQQQLEFLINGADANDIALNTITFQPILDALGEFNLITGPLNAEYDRNSGGIISASIKSGTKAYHGDAFEFYRDTFLNTNNFFQKSVSGAPTSVSPYHQHIVGGTVGGPVAPFLPILRNKLFVFGAFQASPQRAPQGSGSVTLYTTENLGGNFSGDNPAVIGTRPTNIPDPVTKVIPGWGNYLGDFIPSTITVAGCTTPGETWAQCAYDKQGSFPAGAFNTVATALVNKYIPPSLINNGSNGYLFNETITQTLYQEDGRVDFNPNSMNQFSFVGIYQFQNVSNTLPFSGATVPGFGDGTVAHTQQYSFDYVRQFGSTAVNDFGVHWTRFNDKSSYPQQIVQPSSAGFSITPQDATASTVPQLAVSGFFTLGGTGNGPQPRIDQNYQIEDNFSKTMGGHALKFGFDGRRFNVSNIFDANNSGTYAFNNTGSTYSTGDPSLDFLLGIPASYAQGTGAIIQADAMLTYFYGQDTWKATKDLTINYGIGYTTDTPIRNHQFGGLGIGCFIIGQQSKTFPGSPLNLSFPGDPGCTNSGQATTRHDEIGPRIGFSWAPNLGKISGGEGKFSVRGGFGIYYNRAEEEEALQTLGTPPFGFSSEGAADFGGSPSLVNPFADINGGLTTGTGGTPGTASENNRFPYAEPKAGSAVSFAASEPILNIAGFGPRLRSPYAENFQLSVERELPSKVVARVSYVGSLSRQNQVIVEANPETAAGHAECVSDPVCISDRNNQAIDYPANKLADSTSGIVEFGDISSGTSSSYNSLQASVTKGETHGLLFQLSYTWAHAIDTGSSLENTGFGYNGARGFNQYQPSLNKGDSTFDARQRLVFSPVYTVPFKHGSGVFSPYNLALSGWQISGIMTLATGFPYDIAYGGTTSRSLYCDDNLSFPACPDVPNQTAPLVRSDPRVRIATGLPHSGDSVLFSPSSFTAETIGTFGNIGRNPYHGPGLNNTNAIIAKNFALGANGSRYLQVRMESDNVFNHTQFSNPVGQYGAGTFGMITGAVAARQTQLAAKIVF